MSTSSTVASLYTIPSSKTVTGITMTVVAVTMTSISWRSCLLLKVKWDGRLHVTHIGSSKLEMKLFSFRKELARVKECLWHRSILWVVCSIEFNIGSAVGMVGITLWYTEGAYGISKPAVSSSGRRKRSQGH